MVLTGRFFYDYDPHDDAHGYGSHGKVSRKLPRAMPTSQSQLKQSPMQAGTQRLQLLLNDLETCTLQLHLNGPFYLIKSQDQRVKN